MGVNPGQVDINCGLSSSARIHRDENGLRWVFMLNFTNIDYGTYGFCGSNNKFYMGQLIEDNGGYVVFRCWGRVGQANPGSKLEHHATLEGARKSFSRIFQSKSGNRWPLEQPFQRKSNKYVLIDLDHDTPDLEGHLADASDEDEKSLPCSLPKPVQDLLELVCDSKTIAHDMETLHVDLKRMPLGRLSKTQIAQGYTILQQLSDVIEEIANRSATPTPPLPPAAPASSASHVGVTTRSGGRGKRGGSCGRGRGRGNGKGKAKATGRGLQGQGNNVQAIAELRKSLKTLSSEFYTLIPHSFGRSLPPTIISMEDVKQKLDLLDVLSNVEITQELEAAEAEKWKNTKRERKLHPLDLRYQTIQAKMEPLDPASEEFKLIETFAIATREIQFKSQELHIHSILKVARPAEESNAELFSKINNHQLLWHGTRLSNVVGILSQGLRVAPPTAPSSGYNFGKGIYFADALAKSSVYCYTTYRSKAVLFLAEVALGAQFKTSTLDYGLSLEAMKKRNCDSTLGLGLYVPQADGYQFMPDGVAVPTGKFKPVNEVPRRSLLYNEYIVYRPEQVKLRYVLTVTL